MIKVKITYDPYHMSTSININGINVKKSTSYEKIGKFAKQSLPLQSWMDAITFQKWRGLLIEIVGNSNESEVAFIFRGREIDYQDFKDSMLFQAKYENNGIYDIDVSFESHFIYDDKIMLERVQRAYNLIRSNTFKRIIEDKNYCISKDDTLWKEYENLETLYNSAMDSEFRIVFSGMYSSGKSTLINAILGKALLPMSDGTCTSKVFKIIHDSTVKYAKMHCLDKNGNVVVPEEEYDAEQLTNKFISLFPRGADNELLPSVPASIDTVVIRTNISSLYPSNASYNENTMQLVIIDTPGTSSGEGNMVETGPSHVDITRGVIESEKKEIIILATSAIEDKDDSIQDFLEMVDDSDEQGIYDQRFFFVLNKADCCTFNANESWETKFGSIKKYYLGNKIRKIQNPRFFPTSAMGTLKIRTGSVEDDSSYEGVSARYYTFNRRQQKLLPAPNRDKYYFDEVCATSQNIKNQIKARLQTIESEEVDSYLKMDREIELHSGIVSLELSIQDYIERYAFPIKIQSLLKTYESIFKEVGQVLTLTSSQFEKNRAALEDLVNAREIEEEEHRQERLIQQKLQEVSNEVAEKRHLLEHLLSVFTKSSLQEAKNIKSLMEIAIEEAIKKGTSTSCNRDQLFEEIEHIIQTADEECHQNLKRVFSARINEIRQIQEEIKTFYERVKAIVQLEGFSIELTTDFEKLNASSLTTIKVLENNVRNDAYYTGKFTRFAWQRKLRGWWCGIKETKKEFSLDKEMLKTVLQDMRQQLDERIDNVFLSNRNQMQEAVNSLNDNLSKIKEKIEDQMNRIRSIKENIDNIASDIHLNKLFESQLQTDIGIIMSIHEALDFRFDDEEQEGIA